VLNRSQTTIADGSLNLFIVAARYEDEGGSPLVFRSVYMVAAANQLIYEFQIETHWDDYEGLVSLMAAVWSFRPSAATVATPTPYEARVLALGFTPFGSTVSTLDGSGGSLDAVKGICAGSSSGYCQQVFFFHDGEYLGTDAFSPSSSILELHAAGVARIAVTYANYAPSDALCCPSLSPVTITYTWDGGRLQASGEPPGH